MYCVLCTVYCVLYCLFPVYLGDVSTPSVTSKSSDLTTPALFINDVSPAAPNHNIQAGEAEPALGAPVFQYTFTVHYTSHTKWHSRPPHRTHNQALPCSGRTPATTLTMTALMPILSAPKRKVWWAQVRTGLSPPARHLLQWPGGSFLPWATSSPRPNATRCDPAFLRQFLV